MEEFFIGLEVVYYVVKIGLLFKDKNNKPKRNNRNKKKNKGKKKRPSKK